MSSKAIFVALECEARPLIDQLGLKKQLQKGPIKLYEGKHFHLVITGVGGIAMMTAVGFFHGMYPGFCGHLLNVGVAGHEHLRLGTLCYVDQVTCSDESSSIYLNPAVGLEEQRARCHTVAVPQQNYDHPTLYDMEAYYFLQAALTFQPIDLLHVIKVVSDNRDHPVVEVTAPGIQELIKPAVMPIKSLMLNLPAIVHQEDRSLIAELSKRFIMTSAEKEIAAKLLYRLDVLGLMLQYDGLSSFKHFQQVAHELIQARMVV